MSRPSSAGKKLAASFAIVAAVGTFVSFGVFSAFSDTEQNTSTLKSAAFALTKVPSGNTSLIGTITGLLPGDSITRCLKLTNDSDIPVTVEADPSLTNTTGTLVSALTVTLQEVASMTDPTSSSQCTGAATAGAGYLIGTSALAPVSGTTFAGLANVSLGEWAAAESHYYRTVITLPSSVTDAALGGNEASGALNFIATQKAGLAGAR